MFQLDCYFAFTFYLTMQKEKKHSAIWNNLFIQISLVDETAGCRRNSLNGFVKQVLRRHINSLFFRLKITILRRRRLTVSS